MVSFFNWSLINIVKPCGCLHPHWFPPLPFTFTHPLCWACFLFAPIFMGFQQLMTLYIWPIVLTCRFGEWMLRQIKSNFIYEALFRIKCNLKCSQLVDVELVKHNCTEIYLPGVYFFYLWVLKLCFLQGCFFLIIEKLCILTVSDQHV